LHLVQVVPLPRTVSCFSKVEVGCIFVVPAHQVVPDKGLLNVLLLLLLWYVITGSITRRYISYSKAAVEVFAPQGRHVAPMGVQQWPWTEGPLLHGTPARQVSPPSVQR